VFTEVQVESFKCFENLTLRLCPLTLLSGVNGGGKSSVIQSLMLLAQTIAMREWGRSLLLEGPELALGSVADVLNHQSARRHLLLGVATPSERVAWRFKAEDRRALSMELDSLIMNGNEADLTAGVRWLLPRREAETSTVVKALRRLSWITAERTGPRELLPLRDAQGHAQVGPRGELAAGLVYWREGDEVSRALCFPETPPTLFNQVRRWMQEFFPRCDFRVASVEGASAVTLCLRSDAKSNFQRPQNVGFGLTQLFPIIVAVLAASEGDIILIENPEVHLHPKAQQDIGTLLARVAASGVQILVETHSDHVLNGIRLAVKSKSILPADVAIHFFCPTSDGVFLPKSPHIDEDGRLDEWPEGFFDQFDVALSKLL